MKENDLIVRLEDHSNLTAGKTYKVEFILNTDPNGVYVKADDEKVYRFSKENFKKLKMEDQ